MLNLRFDQYIPVPDDDKRLKGAGVGEVQYNDLDNVMYVRKSDYGKLLAEIAKKHGNEYVRKELFKLHGITLN